MSGFFALHSVHKLVYSELYLSMDSTLKTVEASLLVFFFFASWSGEGFRGIWRNAFLIRSLDLTWLGHSKLVKKTKCNMKSTHVSLCFCFFFSNFYCITIFHQYLAALYDFSFFKTVFWYSVVFYTFIFDILYFFTSITFKLLTYQL